MGLFYELAIRHIAHMGVVPLLRPITIDSRQRKIYRAMFFASTARAWAYGGWLGRIMLLRLRGFYLASTLAMNIYLWYNK